MLHSKRNDARNEEHSKPMEDNNSKHLPSRGDVPVAVLRSLHAMIYFISTSTS